MNTQKLVARQLAKKYGKREIIKNVSLELANNEIVGLLGPNGAGKTTFFSMLLGFVRPDKGNILLNGEDITKLPIDRRSKKGLGFLPQEASIFRKLSVADNIMAILELNKKQSRKQLKERQDQLIEEFGLEHIRESLGLSLSGGERRRVEIARALATEPTFILLDEPFAGVDPVSVHEINKLIVHLKEKNMGVLITDHNIRETLAICHRVYIIGEGNVMAHGNKQDILKNARVREVYLGEHFNM